MNIRDVRAALAAIDRVVNADYMLDGGPVLCIRCESHTDAIHMMRNAREGLDTLKAVFEKLSAGKTVTLE